MAELINEVEQAQQVNREQEANGVDRVEEAQQSNVVGLVDEEANGVDRTEEAQQSNLAGLEYCFTPGKHVNTKLLYISADRQLFKIKSRETTGTRYVCYFTGCNSRVNMKDGVCTYIINNHQHSHQQNVMNKFKVEHDIKVRVQNESGTPRQIFNDECSLNESVAGQMQFGKMRRSLNQNRRRGLPGNPRTVQEVKAYFENEIVISRLLHNDRHSSSPFYKCTVITDDFSYTIFGSDSILSRLQQQQQYLIDGTFKIVPAGPFEQLLTISVENLAHVSSKQ